MAHDAPIEPGEGKRPEASPHCKEMSDPPGERRRWPLLSDSLEACERTVNKLYQTADAEAQHYQRHHKIITALAGLCGMAAVLLAIVQLSSFVPGRWPASIEFVVALIALFAVVLGLVASFQRRYLLERHKAERYRLVKFAFLTDPVLWGGDAAQVERRVDQLSQDVVNIAALTRHALDDWVVQDDVPNIPGKSQTADNTLAALVEYYLLKRLNQQIAYFAQAGRRLGWHRYTQDLPALCFFASVLLALAHFALAVYEQEGGHGPSPGQIEVQEGRQSPFHGQQMGQSRDHGFISELLIVLAACLPVLGAGVRTLHTASERRRNAMRFQAKCYTLEKLREELRRETDADTTFRLLWQCERIMEIEHREWLRLMIEAEWFG
jgi:hypothetical protein